MEKGKHLYKVKHRYRLLGKTETYFNDFDFYLGSLAYCAHLRLAESNQTVPDGRL